MDHADFALDSFKLDVHALEARGRVDENNRLDADPIRELGLGDPAGVLAGFLGERTGTLKQKNLEIRLDNVSFLR